MWAPEPTYGMTSVWWRPCSSQVWLWEKPWHPWPCPWPESCRGQPENTSTHAHTHAHARIHAGTHVQTPEGLSQSPCPLHTTEPRGEGVPFTCSLGWRSPAPGAGSEQGQGRREGKPQSKQSWGHCPVWAGTGPVTGLGGSIPEWVRRGAQALGDKQGAGLSRPLPAAVLSRSPQTPG